MDPETARIHGLGLSLVAEGDDLDKIAERYPATHAAWLAVKAGDFATIWSTQLAALARKLHADPTVSVGEICRSLKVSRVTLYRYLNYGIRHKSQNFQS